MAHAIFNISPVRFLSSIQDHVFTVTPSERATNNSTQSPTDITFTNTSKRHQESPTDRDTIPSVTLQLTLPVENNTAESPLSSSVPIDIPKSQPYSLNVSNHSMNDGLSANMLSASYQSYSSLNGQNNSLLDASNIGVNSPSNASIPADDLTVFFDGLAVHSPAGSYCGGSPNQCYSPVYSNVGSPQSPIYFGSPSCNQENQNFLAGSPFSNALLSSPCSPYFLGSPANASFLGDVQVDQIPYRGSQTSLNQDQCPPSPCYNNNNNYSYLSPSLSATTQVTPMNSPSPHSYTENYLFPPSVPSISRPPSPGDVILTTSEVSDYINSPHYPPVSPNLSQHTSPSLGPLSIITDSSYVFETPEFHNNMADEDLELFPAPLVTLSPHNSTQPQVATGDEDNYLSVKPSNNMFLSSDDDAPKVASSPTSSIIRTTPSGRRAKIHHCPYCNHTSNRANNMREHVQIHNPNRPKPHACKLCGRAFARKHDMNRHYISCKKQLEKVPNEVAVVSS